MWKSLFFSITSILLFSVFSYSQTKNYRYSENWGKAGFNLKSSKSSSVEVIYSIKNFNISNTTIKGETMQNIELPGNLLFNDAGMPNLPGSGKLIAVPEGADVNLKVVDFKIEKYQNINMAPAPVIPMDTEDGELDYTKNNNVYSENKFYPENPVQISKKTEVRGVDAIMLGVTPFQYNPVTKELIVYRDIKISLDFKGGKGEFGDNRLRSKWWDPILEDAFLNYSSLPKIDYGKKITNSKEAGFEYVILTLDNPTYTNWADSIAEFRRKQGISTGVFTIADIPGGNTVASIESWVDNAYNTWTTPPAAVLILADYDDGSNGISSQRYNHPYSGTYITDNKYADVNENDLPDIVFARITANNAAQLETMIKKGLDYERTPPTSADFYNHPISALGWQTERWFQICSEAVRGFWENELGKQPVAINKVYDGTPGTTWSTATNTSTVVNYFGASGLGYLPAQPSDLGGNSYWNTGNSTAINNAINNGSFILQHRDHGGENGWGEPSYSNSNINSLNNTDLTFIMSINCLTGRFDYSSESFAEKFHRHTSGGNPSGALGLIAATQVSYSFVNDTYVWGVYDNMWTNFMPDNTANPTNRKIMPGFANVAGKNFLYQSNWPYNSSSKQITYRLFHMHGDAFLNLYSEVPQNLSVNSNDVHIFGTLNFDVTTEDGAEIALTYFDTLNNKTIILGTGISTGGTTTINMTECPTPGTNMLLTVTKQNYFRYTKNVLVIAPTGPYLISNAQAINDGENGEAEFGEDFDFDITLKNVGSATATGISATLTTTDTYVTSISNGTSVPYSDLVADATETSSGQFHITLENNVPDQHRIQFNLTISDASKASYTSIISFKVNAPVLAIGDLTIDDATGNNDGILDPGETANIVIETTNDGHADIANVISNISSTSTDLTLNSTSTSPVNLLKNETKTFIFNVTANSGTPLGTFADVDYNITAGVDNQYSASSIKEVVIGLIPEFLISTGGSVTTCTGLFYDSGGANGTYQNNEDYVMTFLPSGSGRVIEAIFTAFDIESQSSCNYDDLKIYDGINTSAPLIGEYCGTNSPGDIVATNNDGALTFKFHSDISVKHAGWVAEISCFVTETPEGVLSGGAQNICIGGNSGTMILENNTASITSWEKRVDAGSWTIIANTANTYSEDITTAGVWEYRAVLDNGTYYSNIVTINVNEVTVGGSVSGGTTICEGTSTATLSLSGNTGDITKWQKQLNAGAWTDISNTAATYSETPSEDGVWSYRAVVQNGVCSEENSGATAVTVNPSAVSGTVSANNTQICTGTETILNLTAYEGNIQWQNSTDGTNWTNISGATSETYTTPALTENIYYCAVLSLGSCETVESNSVEIEVFENPVANYTYTMDYQEVSFTNSSLETTSYSWNFGDGNISTEENPVHVYGESGTYSVVLTASNGICEDNEHAENISVNYVGVSKIESNISIYPNPNIGIFYVNLGNLNISKTKISVFSVNGKTIYNSKCTSNIHKIDLKDIAKGIYFIKIISENDMFTDKLILR